MTDRPTKQAPARRAIDRRRILQGVVAGSVGLKFGPAVAKRDDPRKLPPQTDDDIVFPSWEHGGHTITVDDVPLGGPPILAYPRDPGTRVAREKSRLNQILLVKFTEDEFSDDTRLVATGGIVAYSGVCTHTGCSVTEWDTSTRNFLCPCHASQFDPRERAKIIGGPASRPLPFLPLARADNALKVAGPFSGKVGPKKK